MRNWIWALSLAILASGSGTGCGGRTPSVVTEHPPESPAVQAPIRTGLLGTSSFRVSSHTEALSFSFDGKLLASSHKDNLVRIWDVQTGRVLRRFAVGKIGTDRLQFVGKSSAILLSTWTHLELWDSEKGQRIHAFEDHPDWIRGLAVDANGTMAASASRDGTIRIWDLDRKEKASEWQAERHSIDCLAMSRDGRVLATGAEVLDIFVWDVEAQKLIEKVIASDEREFALSPDGKVLAHEKGEGNLALHRIGKPQKDLEIRCSSRWLGPVTFSPQGRCFVSGDWDVPARIHRVDVDLCVIDKRYDGSPNNPDVMAVSPDGKILAAAGENEMICLWEAGIAKRLNDDRGHRGKVLAVKWGRDGSTLLTAGDDWKRIAWNTATGEVDDVRTDIFCLGEAAFSRDGVLASEEWKEGLRLYRGTSEVLFRRLRKFGESLVSLAWSLKGDRIASGWSGGTISAWDAASGQVLLDWNGSNNDCVRRLAFSPDGNRLTGVLDDSSVYTLDINENALVANQKLALRFDCFGAEFSPDGAFLALAGSRILGASGIDVVTGETTISFPLDESVNSIAFSTDGRMLFAGTKSGRIVGWEVSTRTLVLDRKAHDGPIDGLDISPDGRFIATGGRDTQAGIWSLKPDAADAALPNLKSALETMAGPDPAAAYRAIWTLAGGGRGSLDLFGAYFKGTQDGKVDSLISQLESDDIAIRDGAIASLRELDVRSEPRMSECLGRQGLPAVIRAQLSTLLGDLSLPPSKCLPAAIRRHRVFQALEFMGPAESSGLLRSLIAHASETIRTQAQQVLNRFVERNVASAAHLKK